MWIDSEGAQGELQNSPEFLYARRCHFFQKAALIYLKSGSRNKAIRKQWIVTAKSQSVQFAPVVTAQCSSLA
jgi:hypothetical protein